MTLLNQKRATLAVVVLVLLAIDSLSVAQSVTETERQCVVAADGQTVKRSIKMRIVPRRQRRISKRSMVAVVLGSTCCPEIQCSF